MARLRPKDDGLKQPHAAISRRLSLREGARDPACGYLGEVEHYVSHAPPYGRYMCTPSSPATLAAR